MNYLGGLVLSMCLFAPAAAQTPVPVEAEPRHRLRFTNEHVRVFDVLIPPGDVSLFHTHVHDGLGVRLTDARIRDEVLDGASYDVAVTRGGLSFSHRPRPLTHRVHSIGATQFRIVFVELVRGATQPSGAASPALVEDDAIVLDNDRMRVTRRVLAAGESIQMHEHALPGLAVALSDGRIAVDLEGDEARTVKFRPADTRWQAAGTRHSWRNAGAAPFEALEIEVKHDGGDE